MSSHIIRASRRVLLGEPGMAEEEEDPWSDGDGDGGEGPRESEWQSRNFHTLGYRDGLFAGKESSAQKGFDAGFKESAPAGFDWGIARGITSAFAALSPRHQELLAPDKNARDDLKSLRDSISGISSNDALASYHSHQVLRDETSSVADVGFLSSQAKAAADKASIAYDALYKIVDPTISA